jgi:alkanesulfonate monooxygenase SsuD/methylene tetrahydromethanopterin reductase-like flavin-dependent oxidoreductase (luciferase family)
MGIGTGNTAMRAMGQRPMKLAEYDEYLGVLAALLRGEVVDYRYRDRVRPIKMLTDNKKYMSLEPKIPLYVSGFGPKAMELAGKHGDGLVFAIPPRGVPVREALGHAAAGAAPGGPRASRQLQELRADQRGAPRAGRGGGLAARRALPSAPTSWRASTTSTTRCTSAASSRRSSCGRSGSATARLVEQTPREHRHFRTHEFHYTNLHPGEAELIDAALIRATCLVGPPEAVVEQVRELERQGLQE